MIQAPKLEPRIMRYELADYEWAAIRPMLPNKARGVPRVDDRRVLNGIFWVLRSGTPWRDLPDCYGPYTTCYNRFVRWRRAGVWGRIMNALAAAHDAAVQMIDTPIVRVHQHAACVARNKGQSMGRSRGGLTSKIHALVDTNGLPVRLGLTAGEAHDNRLAAKLLSRLKSGSMLLAARTAVLPNIQHTKFADPGQHGRVWPPPLAVMRVANPTGAPLSPTVAAGGAAMAKASNFVPDQFCERALLK
jgi:transposase